MSNRKKLAVYCVVFAAFMLVVGPIQYWAWRTEAAAYNRATGANLTWWDAMWLDLRVQADPTRKGEQ